MVSQTEATERAIVFGIPDKRQAYRDYMERAPDGHDKSAWRFSRPDLLRGSANVLLEVQVLCNRVQERSRLFIESAYHLVQSGYHELVYLLLG